MSFNKLTLEEKLITKAKWEGNCLVWFGQKDAKGYGRLRLDKKLQRSHRLAYELKHGKLAAGIVVLHSCDNPSCINLEHLSAGTQQDNINDMLNKNRANKLYGENHINSKLSKEIVTDIRKRFIKYDRKNGARSLGREFGVSHVAISSVVNGKTWLK